MKKLWTKIIIIFICVFLIGLVGVSVHAEPEPNDEEPTEETPVEEVTEQEEPKIQTIIVEKAYEIKDWIVAFVVAILSSGACLGLAAGIIKLIAKKIKEKINTLEKNAQISKEQAELARKQLADLTVQVETVYLPALEKYANEIKDYIQVEKAKSERVNNLLETIIKPALEDKE